MNISRLELKIIEQYADALFAEHGIDVEFQNLYKGTHFLDRLNDPRNDSPITLAELKALFKKVSAKYGDRLGMESPGAQGVLKDMQSNIAIPFILKWDDRNRELDLIPKTIMKKRNFVAKDRSYNVEMKMTSIFKSLLEASEKTGKLEMATVSIDTAKQYVDSIGLDIDRDFSDFDTNFMLAKKRSHAGSYERRQMPVLRSANVKMLQAKLKRGFLDVTDPYSDFDYNKGGSDPFPQGLSGKQANQFVSAGLHDGDLSDDIVDVSIRSVPVGKLLPIQRQIYFDHAVEIIKSKRKNLDEFLSSHILIASKDNYIIDGHHRFLAGVLYNPKLLVKVLSIDLPISKLLPLALAYGDAIGNRRNK